MVQNGGKEAKNDVKISSQPLLHESISQAHSHRIRNISQLYGELRGDNYKRSGILYFNYNLQFPRAKLFKANYVL